MLLQPVSAYAGTSSVHRPSQAGELVADTTLQTTTNGAEDLSIATEGHRPIGGLDPPAVPVPPAQVPPQPSGNGTEPRGLFRRPAGPCSGADEQNSVPTNGALLSPAPAPPEPPDSSGDSDNGTDDNDAPEADPEDPEELPDVTDDPLVEPSPVGSPSWEGLARAVRPRTPQPPTPQEQQSRVRAVLQQLEQSPGEPKPHESESLLAELTGIAGAIPNADDFVAGSFAHSLPAWEEMMRGHSTRSGRRVLGWLRHGFKPVFGNPTHAKPAKKKVVIDMLKKEYPGRDPNEFLTGNRPHQVAFRNHQSFYRHWEFSSAELLKLLLWGAIEIVKPGDEPVVVVSPLGVADQDGKERLFLNGRYVNIFLKELPFKYQRLRDVILFLDAGSFMSTWDLKSGYYHILLHPSFQKYMGFRVGGLVFRYKVPAFGLSQACFLFTKLMNEPAKALRLRGVPLSDYIDDAFTAAKTFNRCVLQAVLAVKLLGALGAFLGLPKCHLLPEQLRQWLGFLVNSENQTFELSASRLAKLKRQLQDVLNINYVSARKLASLAGRIVSASPAILPASLFSRPFFMAIQGQLSWDALFPTQQSVKDAAEFWLRNIDRFNGRPWHPAPVALRATVDASGVGFGGVLEADGQQPLLFRGTFSVPFAAASSTAREVAGYVEAVRAAALSYGATMRDSSLLITGDSQAAVNCINNFRSSSPDVNDLLRTLFDICLAAGCNVQARWVPRQHIQQADALSRDPDAADWGLAPQLVADIVAHFGVRPACDLFASAHHHVSDNFVSKFYEPGCSAVQAMRLDWRTVLQPDQTAWVFPPLHLAGQVLERVRSFKTNAIFVIRGQKASNEMIALHALPGASVSAPFSIPKVAASCRPTLRVPPGTVNPAFMGLLAFYIKW